MNELWVSAAGWPGYEVSDRGNVRSLDRIVLKRNGTRCRIRGKVMNQRWNKTAGTGHLTVGLRSCGRANKAVKVHTLVLESFIGPRPLGMHGCHYDDDGSNNALSNLRWDTPSANGLDRSRNGRCHLTNRARCIRGHLFDREYIDPKSGRRRQRYCRQCATENQRARRKQRNAA